MFFFSGGIGGFSFCCYSCWKLLRNIVDIFVEGFLKFIVRGVVDVCDYELDY